MSGGFRWLLQPCSKHRGRVQSRRSKRRRARDFRNSNTVSPSPHFCGNPTIFTICMKYDRTKSSARFRFTFVESQEENSIDNFDKYWPCRAFHPLNFAVDSISSLSTLFFSFFSAEDLDDAAKKAVTALN